jgi:predicted metal-dependent hydrolase
MTFDPMAKPPEMLLIADRAVPLAVRRSPRARRITLRVDDSTGAVVLTLPRRVALSEGLAFADEKQRWIERRLDSLPPRVAFEAGARIPVLGRERRVVWTPGPPRAVRLDGPSLRVGGERGLVTRRLEAWFKRHAREEISARVEAMCRQIRTKPGRLAIRDTRSRWGSASVDGNLNFSWRLVMAPDWVLDYVVAHEVAHLKHMNHGRRFWAVVEKLVGDPDPAKRWLRAHGSGLHRYG